jgi:DNA-binding response OmpR family regulator
MLPSIDPQAARILIVDDQKTNVCLLELTLRRAGYVEVMTTTEPRAVFALFLQHRFDLIMIDLQMPEMNGYEVIKQVRRISGGERVALLAMSADPEQMLAALQAGGSAFMGKPFLLADVVARVRLLLELANVRDLEESRISAARASRYVILP